MKCLFSVLISLFFISVKAQTSDEYRSYFTVGQKCPDYQFADVVNFTKKNANIQDFKGKWLILDFWHKDCSACIAGFPVHNEEQKKYGKSIQFLLVGGYDNHLLPYKATKEKFTELRKRLKLVIPCAFDTLYNRTFPEEADGRPFIVLIDPDGIVRGASYTLEGVDLSKLTITNRPILPDFYRDRFNRNTEMRKHNIFKYDYEKPFLVKNNGGADSDFIFRSILKKWNTNETTFGNQGIITNPAMDNVKYRKTNGFTGIGLEIATLYMYAYTGRHNWNYDSYTNRKWVENKEVFEKNPLYGTTWPEPLILLNDSLKLREKYSYSLTLPVERGGEHSLKKFMKQDLANYFGYDVEIEIRRMPCWKLTATDIARERLRTNDNKKGLDKFTVGHYPFRNVSMDLFLSTIIDGIGHFRDNAFSPYVSDETGVKNNIDITLNCVPNDLPGLIKELRKNGLEVVKSTKEMKVIVIRDPKPTVAQADVN